MFLIVSKHDKKKAPDERGFDGWGILNIWPMWCCAHRHFRSTFLEFVSASHCCWVVHMHHNVALWKGRGIVHGYRSNLWHCLTANGWALSCQRWADFYWPHHTCYSFLFLPHLEFHAYLRWLLYSYCFCLFQSWHHWESILFCHRWFSICRPKDQLLQNRRRRINCWVRKDCKKISWW